jgi:hypothetical protein
MLARYFVGLSLATLLAAPLSAAAADMTPISDRILSDPTFLPLKGEFYGESSYDYTHDHTNYFDDTGAQISSISRRLNTLRQYFAFGITDQLSVNVSEAYGFSGQVRTTTAAGVTSNNLSGWEDPTIGVTYRLIDQRSNPMSLDVITHYSPDAFSAHTATSTSDGSIARGGPAADFGLAIGRETRAFTIRGSLTANYFGRSSTSNPLSAATTTVASYWVPSLGIQTQARLNDRLSLNVNGSYNFNGDPVVANSFSGLAHTENLGDYETIGAGLNYHFIPNKLVGSVNYTHVFRDHTSLVYPSDAALDETRTGSQDNVGVSLLYVFK